MITLPPRLQPLAPYVPHIGALLLVAVLGWTVALVRASGTPNIANSEEKWSLPKWAPYVAGEARQEVLGYKIWAENPDARPVDAAAAKPPPPVAPWIFVGTVEDGESWQAIIELQQPKKIQRVSEGDSLPDGHVVQAVADGELTVMRDDEVRTLKLFAEKKPSIEKK